MNVNPTMCVHHPRGRVRGCRQKKHHSGHKVTRLRGYKVKAPHGHKVDNTLRLPTCRGAVRALVINPTPETGVRRLCGQAVGGILVSETGVDLLAPILHSHGPHLHLHVRLQHDVRAGRHSGHMLQRRLALRIPSLGSGEEKACARRLRQGSGHSPCL